MHPFQNEKVAAKFAAYPTDYKEKMLNLRRLVLETAAETEGVGAIEETLKWNEPSYLAKHGSTIRMDWKSKKPDQYAIYFKCTSKLVNSFKAVFGDTFRYETTRAIVFFLDDEVPEAKLKQCITAALTYHKVKQFPLLQLDT